MPVHSDTPASPLRETAEGARGDEDDGRGTIRPRHSQRRFLTADPTLRPLPFPAFLLYNTLIVACVRHYLPRNRTVSTERTAS